MPILADALQDAGCADENILSHCRGSGHRYPNLTEGSVGRSGRVKSATRAPYGNAAFVVAQGRVVTGKWPERW